MTITELIDEVIDVREGGLVFTHDAPDPPTFAGITLDTARRFYGPSFTAEQLAKLTRSDVEAIYLRLFVLDPGFHLVRHDALRSVLVDFGINSGTTRAARELQQLLFDRGVLKARSDIDGVVGPRTIAAIDNLTDSEQEELSDDLAVARALFCARLVQDDINAFLQRFAQLKQVHPDIVSQFFPGRRDELDYAAYAFGWIRRALSSI